MPTDADIRIDADDLIALRARATRLRPLRGRVARSALSGSHRSRFRGRGMDYRESRHYQAGDDIRNMDWRITARAGDPHVKVFDEERERPIVVLVDLGPTMQFASRGAFKAVVAARLAALIGWSAVGRGDRIGALIFNGGHRELVPTGGRRGQMQLIRALAHSGAVGARDGVPAGGAMPADGRRGTTAATTDEPAPGLRPALARLRRVARPGSRVFLISDFYGLDEGAAGHLAQLVRHNDLSALQILDPLEIEPPPPGRYRISDGRRSGLLRIGGGAAREFMAARLAAHQARIRTLIEGAGVGLVQCRTIDDPAACLALLLPARGRGAGTMVQAGRRGHAAVRA
jgi:uncharacterized protein (DUF58 family)